MKLLKKILSVLLAAALLLSVFNSLAEAAGSMPPETPPGSFGNGSPQGTPPDGFAGGNPPGEPPDGFGGGTPPGFVPAETTYIAATEINGDMSQQTQIGGTYSSEAADENALLITRADITLDHPSVCKTGNSDGGDSCNFFGLNAAVLIMDGSDVVITGGTIESSASGANGIFVYGGNGGSNGAAGDGTVLHVSGTSITTTGDGSGGIMTTGGGLTYAENLTVTTSGRSSAPIRTDRGGGTVVVDGGTYTSRGLGSPVIYSTADITVKNAKLVSSLSEGVCIEGMNSIALENCDLTADNTQCNGNATFLDTIMIYQSMSGDADSGTSSFTMSGGSLTSLSGHMFHVTNTHAVITLSEVNLINEGSDVLLSVCDDGWTGASNTADLVADAQTLAGTLLVGSNSTLTLTLKNGSSFSGCVSGEITSAKGTQVSAETGTVSVSLDETSTWTLTADTYITAFSGRAANVTANGYALYVNGVAFAGTN